MFIVISFYASCMYMKTGVCVAYAYSMIYVFYFILYISIATIL